MSEPRDPLLEAIHAAGEVPPPPDRDAAFARAVHSVLTPSRRRLNRSVIALFAAALLAVPAGVFAARAPHTPAAIVAPIKAETADPSSSIRHEADDSNVRHVTVTDSRSSSPSGSDSGDIYEPYSGDSTRLSSDSSASGNGSGGAGIPTPTPTPTPSETLSSDGSPDGGSPAPSN